LTAGEATTPIPGDYRRDADHLAHALDGLDVKTMICTVKRRFTLVPIESGALSSGRTRRCARCSSPVVDERVVRLELRLMKDAVVIAERASSASFSGLFALAYLIHLPLRS
jgi:predicted PP-loop superfamily ATPase